MSTEVLIGIQVLVVLLLVISALALLLRRQKKTIAQLQAILTDVKDEISGDSLVRHFQLEIDSTTAHCRQETIALKPDLTPEDMAISLRFIALQTELALVQDNIGTSTPWREQIKRYEELAQKIHDIIKARVDYATQVLNDVHADENAAKQQTITELEATRSDLQKQLKNLKPLRDFIDAATGGNMAPLEIEQKLHRSLLELCENFPSTEKLRELVFLLHETFNEMVSREDNTQLQHLAETPAGRKPVAIDPSQNIGMLNNIINKQNDTIRTLRKQIDALGNEQERVGMHNTVDIMQLSVESSGNALQSLQNGIEFSPPADGADSAEMYKIVEKFTEESAQMVERIHLLSNENKQLMLENEKMRQTTGDGSEQEQPLVAGLKLKIEKQNQEILSLQKNLKELEENYLALYEEKSSP